MTRDTLSELVAMAIAAECNATRAAQQHGKTSAEYQRSLTDLATMWHLLKQNRHPDEFVKDVAAA